ncbi:hypothetical protein PISL3812_00936 [Talaromyces islandicus]|uniref:Btz domain-containing protein n=1 Tax=Talaromyces islandicus TaxID=28573 RepID=A0A0U1LKS4_TALIS|nr:hypothetical protein PISL3812_00936 [Talaromyces islandicus]
MAPARRHRIGASRRRREDDGEEEEGSVVGAAEDDSMSDSSLSHQEDDDDDDADEEGSDLSEGEPTAADKTINGNSPARKRQGRSGEGKLAIPVKPQLTATVSDTEAMMNGLNIADRTGEATEIQFEGAGKEERNGLGRAPSAPPAEARRDTMAERKRRDHDEYIKARNEDPAFVPTRGGFFLHDKRSTGPGSNGNRAPNNKTKSRPYGLIVDGNVGRRPKPDATDSQWTHDLHESVARNDGRNSTAVPPSHPNAALTNGSVTVSVAPRSSPPNRSFSTTVLIGNVPVKVSLPGIAPILFQAVPKRQHTRLPQHRPPLRRDKPVRISIPGAQPRYILPAPERSFIFIPRALRPNQQSYRGRGRGGGYYNGRRPSLYAGSTHSPSLSMSRRSSLRESMHSPAGSVLSRQTLVSGESKPVVRLPPMVRPPGPPVHPSMPGVVAPGPMVPAPPAIQQGFNTAYRESRGGPIIMHQPRPQKTVSVADIETPANLHFNPPQPQQEQPFHQQVPVAVAGPGYIPETGHYPHGRHPSQLSQTSGTPLSQIPERAIHAQPFQPYGFPSQQGYYGAGYHPGAMYYPMPHADYPQYNAPAGPGGGGGGGAFVGPPGPPYVMPAPPPPPIPQSQAAGGEQGPQAGTVAHEANGTVYFYDAAEIYSNPSYPPGGVVGMGGMMTPPGTTYYYPQQSGGYYPQ